MENKDLENRKINNDQKLNEGFSGENIPDDYNPAPAKLKADLEIDQEGNETIVQRAAYSDEQNRNWNESESLSRDIEIRAEHKDRNSDVAADRYPNSHPDNHEDHGNMKLDE